MARSNLLFKRCYNQLLDRFAKMAVGDGLPFITDLSRDLEVSASTVNQLVAELERAGLICRDKRRRVLARHPSVEDYFPDDATLSAAERIEEEFLRRIIGGNAQPGDDINELQLAREFGTSTSLVREFLIRFSRFGLIAKRPNRHWVMLGLTPDFIDEVLSVKQSFLMISADAMCALPDNSPLWVELRALRDGLMAFIDKPVVGDRAYQDMEFACQRVLARASRNRFIEDFTETSATIIYYNFQVDRDWEIHENKESASIWVTFIDSIISRDALDIQYWNRKLIEQAGAVYRVAMSGQFQAKSPSATPG